MTEETTPTKAQTDALKAIAKAAEENADSTGFVSRLAATDGEGHVIRSETLEALRKQGLIEIRDDGEPDVWLKLTASGRKPMAK